MKATGKLARTELVHRCCFPDPEVASSDIFKYLEEFYNRCSSHSALSYRSAADYEETTVEGADVPWILLVYETETSPVSHSSILRL